MERRYESLRQPLFVSGDPVFKIAPLEIPGFANLQHWDFASEGKIAERGVRDTRFSSGSLCADQPRRGARRSVGGDVTRDGIGHRHTSDMCHLSTEPFAQPGPQQAFATARTFAPSFAASGWYLPAVRMRRLAREMP